MVECEICDDLTVERGGEYADICPSCLEDYAGTLPD
jgi:ribosomal protein L37AE/L43A|tara:strand:- start:3235 stop:3342 length:108 start_codon:yes stop_codon:yes gene_type:complete